MPHVFKTTKKLPELLSHILIRRTRNHILRFYGVDATTHQPVDASNFQPYLDGSRRAYVIVGGKHQFFPKRELETIEYSIENTYQGLYQELRQYLGKPRSEERNPVSPRNRVSSGVSSELSYARYGLWNYVLKDKQRQEPYASLQRAGANLRGLMRVMLFKRFESSVCAFRETIAKMVTVHQRFLDALSQGFVPAGEEAQNLLYSEYNEEEIIFPGRLETATTQTKSTYVDFLIEDFDAERLRQHIQHDIQLLKKILALVVAIAPEKDAKFQTLKQWLSKPPLKDKKLLIFTQYADTAKSLYENLNPKESRADAALQST